MSALFTFFAIAIGRFSSDVRLFAEEVKTPVSAFFSDFADVLSHASQHTDRAVVLRPRSDPASIHTAIDDGRDGQSPGRRGCEDARPRRLLPIPHVERRAGAAAARRQDRRREERQRTGVDPSHRATPLA